MSVLQVFTEESKVLQVDSNYNNFRLLKTYRVVGAFNSPKVFRCTEGMVYAVAPFNLDNNIAITPEYSVDNGVPIETIKVYGDALILEFTHEKRNPSVHGIGFEMYDEGGEVILSSEDVMLRVSAQINGSVAGRSSGSIIHQSQTEFYRNNRAPNYAYVLGLVPKRYTGGSWYNVPIGGYVRVYEVYYQVSTLFFSRRRNSNILEDFSISFNQFYYSSKYQAIGDAEKNAIPIYDSSHLFSILEIDLRGFAQTMPEPILL